MKINKEKYRVKVLEKTQADGKVYFTAIAEERFRFLFWHYWDFMGDGYVDRGHLTWFSFCSQEFNTISEAESEGWHTIRNTLIEREKSKQRDIDTKIIKERIIK